MSTQMESVVDSISSALGTIAPIALPLLGIVLVVTIGIGVFNKVTKKSTGA